MVKKGDIIKLNFDPRVGHEQAGYRPALVVSNHIYNKATNLTIVCPITNTKRPFPLHEMLDERTKTTGCILCEQLKAVDLHNRQFQFVEAVPEDILDTVIQKIKTMF